MSPLAARTTGPAPLSSAQEIRFGRATKPVDREAVLALRRLAYDTTGKLPLGARAAHLDGYDGWAIHVTAYNGAEVVGSVRVIPPVPGLPFSYARNFLTPPGVSAASAGLVEASRMCIHPLRQGCGLFWPLAARMVLAAVELGGVTVIGGATHDFLKPWAACGFRVTGDTYQSRDFGGLPHHLFALDVSVVLRGEGISPRFADALDAARRTAT